jgi:hydroxymethylpyrimidine/phosphomethylpyrimidine kinase
VQLAETSEYTLPIGLTIAGYDPSGAAGILADVKTFSLIGVYGLAVPTCLTVQNFENVRSVLPIPDEYFQSSLQHLSQNIKFNVIKIGLLSKISIIQALRSFLAHLNDVPVILDPVIQSSSGFLFLNEPELEKLKSDLFPHITLLTPNLPELARLSGMEIRSRKNILFACKQLTMKHRFYILVKGGHSDDAHEVTDYFFNPDYPELIPFSSGRIATTNLRGTGCILSSSIAAFIAKGFPVEEAVRQAKTILNTIINQNKNLDWGTSSGPLWHFQNK